MLDLDRKYSPKLHDRQQKAKDNRRDLHSGVKAGQRIHAEGYVEEPEYDHAGIHLYDQAQDEIIWYSEEPINFFVDIHRDPELVLLAKDLPPKSTESVNVGKIKGIENPFVHERWPLESRHGEPGHRGF